MDGKLGAIVKPTLEATRTAFLSGEVLSQNYVQFTEEDCLGLDIWIGRLLRTVSLEFLQEVLFTVLSELVTNGYKANSKRVLFKQNQLDLKNETDYSQGMQFFKNDFASKKANVIELLNNSPYRVVLEARHFEKYLLFSVTNNADLMPEEEERIRKRISASKKFDSIGDAYKDSLDSEESSGLGIILIHILLRNSGVQEDLFELEKGDGFTRVNVKIPKSLLDGESQRKIRQLFESEIDGLPPIPVHIQRLLILCSEIDVSWDSIASEVEKEPAIAVEILKIANSTFLLSKNSITDIKEGLIRIGMQNIRNVFLTLAARKILDSRYPEQINIWTHGLKTSIYARSLCERNADCNGQESIATLCGLIHDLGRMVLISLDIPFLTKINAIRMTSYEDVTELAEEFIMGISHSEIGYLLAKKWGFSEFLLDVIRFHHKPWMCESKARTVSELIYISDIYSHFLNGKGNYNSVESEILEKFGIFTEEEFFSVGRELEESFQSKVLENKDNPK